MSNIQISNILLWQKDQQLRNLEFRHNHVNVITGDAGKGKSSILFIIDYCLLASETKGISKTNIDSKVDWYGVRLSIDGKELVIARPSESQQDSERAYFSEDGIIPERPSPNIRIDNLKRVLNKAFGIDPELRVPYGGKFIQANQKVSFRNFLAHCYQDQTTIIAPDYLYIRPGDGRYQEGIERTFRMAIGAENVKTALARSQLTELERKKAAQARKQQVYDKTAHAFSDELGQLGRDATTFGLIDSFPDKPTEQVTALRLALDAADILPAQIEAADRIEAEIFELRAKNRRLMAFVESGDHHKGALRNMADALKPASLFDADPEQVFPSFLAHQVVSRLRMELDEIQQAIRSRDTFPFLKEVQTLIDENEKRIVDLRATQADLQNSQAMRQSPQSYHRYLGRLESKLELYARSDDLRQPVVEDDLDAPIRELQAAVDANRQKTAHTKEELNRRINARLTRLKLKGYEGFSAHFGERDRLLTLYSPDLSQTEKMPDIGSASNYLYLHVAYFLALHEIARLQRVPWMPSFLVLDQPSTPYWTDGKPTDDILSLDVVLRELNGFVQEMDAHGGFQIIVLEHIEETHWTGLGLERFHLVDRELREGYGLILSGPAAPARD
ncbi:DUF3732 domain-containing protein [Paraburkholderia sabiae]|uniref:DUF3732 domain-containing protein n=1 Tax=Paraburkholderia sabiae TaxID=273251 RepID=A0ABU9QML1_9BURK|nr:DUF3732 domain-containing protein [Paraburkholderia sabiae]WJZ79154.1 DUF3732 domain-containing protein [Paraburkholderia sabiae]CAD6514492.1 hypothetical protein LMG24235_00931 [Paraburkholderia sabiae]